MMVMFAEIVACVVIRGLMDSSRSWEFPLPCLAAEHLIGFPSGKQAFWMVSELFLICHQYIFGILGLFQNPPKFSRRVSIDGAEVLLAKMEVRIAKMKAQRRRYSSLLGGGALSALRAILFMVVVCAGSECVGTIVYGVWIGWVLKNIFSLRTSVPPSDVIAAEAQVGFGQTVSFLLLLSTGRVLHEAFNGKKFSVPHSPKSGKTPSSLKKKSFHNTFLDQAGLNNEAVTRLEDLASSPSSVEASYLEPGQDQNAGSLGVNSSNAPGRRRSFNSQDERQT